MVPNPKCVFETALTDANFIPSYAYIANRGAFVGSLDNRTLKIWKEDSKEVLDEKPMNIKLRSGPVRFGCFPMVDLFSSTTNLAFITSRPERWRYRLADRVVCRPILRAT